MKGPVLIVVEVLGNLTSRLLPGLEHRETRGIRRALSLGVQGGSATDQPKIPRLRSG